METIMQVHSILVHPNSRSLNADLFATAIDYFEKQGHQTTTLDLFASANRINEFLSEMYYKDVPPDLPLTGRETASNLLKKYRHEFDDRTDFIKSENSHLLQSDLLFIQTPIWVWALPALLKSYCECLFFPGTTFRLYHPWDDEQCKIYPGLTGKKVLFSLTMGSCQTLTESVTGSVENLLMPIKYMFTFAGYEWMPPHITWGTTNPDRGMNATYIEDFKKFLNQSLPSAQ